MNRIIINNKYSKLKDVNKVKDTRIVGQGHWDYRSRKLRNVRVELQLKLIVFLTSFTPPTRLHHCLRSGFNQHALICSEIYTTCKHPLKNLNDNTPFKTSLEVVSPKSLLRNDGTHGQLLLTT